jgi:hypothetical protein
LAITRVTDNITSCLDASWDRCEKCVEDRLIVAASDDHVSEARRIDVHLCVSDSGYCEQFAANVRPVFCEVSSHRILLFDL